jgi:catecholate siderophore receptor
MTASASRGGGLGVTNRANEFSKRLLTSIAVASAFIASGFHAARAQDAQSSSAPAETAPVSTELPPVTVTTNKPKKTTTSVRAKTKPYAPIPQQEAFGGDAKPKQSEPVDQTTAEGAATAGPALSSKGDAGYLATRGTTATKTDTPLRNVPQSLSVVTRKQIKDQSFQSIGDVSRYVPGIILHQGEGNRDQISIRGQVASSADFFVNGVRDDAQVFRDLYNSERVEFLKGPAALVFGRGGAGGVVNRVTKEAEFRPSFAEVSAEYGMYDHKRTVVDAGTSANNTAAFRIVSMYEDSSSYRDFVDLERWAVNPTLAFKPSDDTKLVLGYEHSEDHRTADRGIPSIRFPGATYGVPSSADRSTFFGDPDLSFADASVNRVYATVEHKTDFGLSVRNHTSWVGYDKFYQNVYPGTSANAPGNGLVGIVAYNNENDRENIFNQTDFTYKFADGWNRHTLLFGAEFGHQQADNWRHNGTFGPGSGQCVSFSTANGSPTGQCNVLFTSPTIFTPNTTFAATSTRNHVEADVRSFYIQDQIEISRYLEIIGGVRHDTFDLQFTNRGPATAILPANAQLSQKDELLSPRFGLVLKPTDTFSIYGSYSLTYLPASGDQFAGVSNATLNLEPEKYTNYEIGAKWDITPFLVATSAIYRTDRENIRFATSPTEFVQSGTSQVEGLELALQGYLTDQWQMTAGYSHIFKGELTSATSATLIAGTPLPLLPEDTISLLNRYQLTPMFGAGVGIVYHAENFATLQAQSNRVELPAFTTVDAALFVKLDKNWNAQMNITNVFNENYIVSADANDNLTPGAPTTAVFSLTTRY